MFQKIYHCELCVKTFATGILLGVDIVVNVFQPGRIINPFLLAFGLSNVQA